MPESAVALSGVTKHFGPKAVLRGVELQLQAGTTVGFVGPNGAGKTTCMRLMVGLAFRDGGTARVLGHDPGRDGVAVRQRCSYLPGECGLYDALTGEETLRFALQFYERRHRDLEDRLRADFALPLDARVREYSSGMKQKLALMAALLPDVDLYLLDEPDRNLDPPSRLQLRDALHELQARDRTILVSSHHLGEVDALSHRLVFLLHGQVVDDARIEAARDRLSSMIRVRLRTEVPLPDGAARLGVEPDGSLRLAVIGEPLRWVARLDPAAIRSLEVGATRLDDLYRVLTENSP
ncbi:MAG: ABC transporter ATP-binding protein [Planctomycetota bacterium]